MGVIAALPSLGSNGSASSHQESCSSLEGTSRSSQQTISCARRVALVCLAADGVLELLVPKQRTFMPAQRGLHSYPQARASSSSIASRESIQVSHSRAAALFAESVSSSLDRSSQHSSLLLAAPIVGLAVLAAKRRRFKTSQRRRTCNVAFAAAPATTASTIAEISIQSQDVEAPEHGSGMLNFARLRKDFPALHQHVRPGVPLVYLDNAATSHKPKSVLAELARFYRRDNSNVHRGMHTLSVRSTEAFEHARAKVAAFIGASDATEVIFTRNATEGINLVAKSWARANIGAGDEIILTVMEHHSNLVPWQLLAQEVGARLRFVGITEDGMLDKSKFEQLLSDRTRLVSMCHVSNVLGCKNPVEWVADRAHAVGARVMVDACQSLPHMKVDVQKLGVDWLVASSHKMCGPTGIGFLWGRAELLRASPPFLGGGEMIDEVNLESSSYADIPHKLEAGTPAFAEAVALGTACDYLSSLGMDKVSEYEHALTEYMWHRLEELPGITLYGPSPAVEPDRAALVCFNVEGCHPNDLATLVDQDKGVAMRAGHHCCQPLHRELGVTASARVSAYIYNTKEEIDIATTALKSAVKLLRGDMSDVSLPDPVLPTGGPSSALAALQELGLVQGTSWADAAECKLADASATITVCAMFDPSGATPSLEELRKLLVLRLCQRYGHVPLCLVTGSVKEGSESEEWEIGFRQLKDTMRRVLDFELDPPAIVVDDGQSLGTISVADFFKEVGSTTEATSCTSVTDAFGKAMRSWSLAQAMDENGADIVLCTSEQDAVVSAGLELLRKQKQDVEIGSDEESALGYITLTDPAWLQDGSSNRAPHGPLATYQYLAEAADEDMSMLLKQLTTLSEDEIKDLVQSNGSDEDNSGRTASHKPAQARLAQDATRLLYGEDGLQQGQSSA